MEQIQRIASEVDQLTNSLETAKDEKNRLTGAYEQAMLGLKTTFGLNTLEEAREALEDAQQESHGVEQKIIKDFDDLKGKFKW